MVKNLPAKAGDTGSILELGRSPMLQGNYDHMPQLLSLCSRARELQLLSLCAATTEARVPYSLCFATGEATVSSSSCTAVRVAPAVSNQRTPVQQRRPSTAEKESACSGKVPHAAGQLSLHTLEPMLCNQRSDPE